MYAMVLASIVPEYTSALMYRAEIYALNRVVCGHLWKSDTNASLMLAAGIFAAVVSTDAYRQQLVKARQEYLSLTAGTQSISSTSQGAQSEAAVYDLQGRRLNGQPTAPGIYISDGKIRSLSR